MTDNGRGAWPSNGRGGTLKLGRDGKTVPGRYYMLASEDTQQIGLKTFCLRYDSQPVSQDYNAVFHAVVGIQLLLNGAVGSTLSGDGIFGPETDKAVRTFQTRAALKSDGQIGPKTMRALLRPIIINTAFHKNEPWEPIYGFLENEGGWDPGAVGYYDPNDWGLAQINTRWHPHVSFAQAFCPSFAINFIAELLRYNLDYLDGNMRDAIAAYNLGVAGARKWIAAGRPDLWTPPGSDVEDRPMNKYIDNILDAWKAT